MKRSDMIDIMYDVVRSWRGECTIDQMVNHILKAQEAAGMSPPGYEPFTGKVLMEWEPEDD